MPPILLLFIHAKEDEVPLYDHQDHIITRLETLSLEFVLNQVVKI